MAEMLQESRPNVFRVTKNVYVAQRMCFYEIEALIAIFLLWQSSVFDVSCAMMDSRTSVVV